MDISTILDLLVNALVAGILLGGFYAAVSIGISIAFGMLDIANISHPAMIMLGSFMAFWLNDRFGWDPLFIMLLLSPLFGLLGMFIYRVYYNLFESREKDPRRGLAFFFGLLFVTLCCGWCPRMPTGPMAVVSMPTPGTRRSPPSRSPNYRAGPAGCKPCRHLESGELSWIFQPFWICW